MTVAWYRQSKQMILPVCGFYMLTGRFFVCSRETGNRTFSLQAGFSSCNMLVFIVYLWKKSIKLRGYV